MATVADPIQRRESSDRPHMRAHKALRRWDLVNTDCPQRSAGADTTGNMNNGFVYSPARALPLTPPAITVEDQKPPPSSQNHGTDNPHVDPQGTLTPTNRINLLTPDITPPRVVSRSKKQDGQGQHLSSVSSRTTSYATARETPSSDEETERVKSIPLLPCKHKLPHPLRNTTVSYANTGEMSPDIPAQVTKQGRPLFDTNELQVHKRSEKKPSPSSRRTQSLQEHLLSHARQGSLRERVWSEQDTTPTASVEAFAASIGWPSESGMDIMDSAQARRISTASTTTIEAVVIDTPPQKKRTLRHIEKNGSLRSVSTPTPSPPSMSRPVQTQAQAQPRLAHKRTRITNEDRRSIASDMSIATASTNLTFTQPKQVEDVIRVVVIPQRRSSLRSSMPPKPTLRSVHPGYHRPATAPDSGVGSFHSSRRHKRRTMSESLTSSSSGPSAFKPKIPARRSSLSAPTSRNTSRAGSISGDSNRTPITGTAMKELLNSKPLPRLPSEPVNQPTPKIQPETERFLSELLPKPLRLSSTSIPTPQIILTKEPFDHAQDGSVRPLTPPGGPSTPFQHSIESLSLSPGPVEISQATAVPFFAHNNKSLLVVEHPLSEARPYTSEMKPPPLPLEYVESPLRHPRAAPKPPDSAAQTTPATPLRRANTLPSRPRPPLPMQTDSSSNGSGLVRRLSSVRRRLSARRTSTIDSIPATTAAKDITSRTHHVRNRMAGRKLDGKEHPFWRPHGFWEDYDNECAISDGNGNATNNVPKTTTTITAGKDLASGGYESGQYVSNTLGIPQNRKPFQGPIALIRRVSQRSRSRPNRLTKSSSKTNITSFSPDSRREKRVRYRPLHEVQDWITRTRQRREQEKLEARREKLRRAIGGNVIVDYHSVASTMDPESVFFSPRREVN
ncbi:uncharacterized protein GIQ15_03221 [Arthroderma uncinatum]|uniref:uncharacterized protein n=1 Tax=Arthroderma uncinatum TaxID=74035 RepID=UPI00144ADEE9|nr:uncharacterized protein GIQ15_03221 [Arthroderma uncinatum]KAF3483897.1 hypothetical protein GIQ15_03221 [Arthroderma uncinatum]